MNLQLNYVTDQSVKALFVQLPVKEFEELLENAEELADIKAYQKAKKQKSKPIPIEEAFA